MTTNMESIKKLRIDIKRVFERNQELFKLLDWYLAQVQYFRKRKEWLRKRKNQWKQNIKLVMESIDSLLEPITELMDEFINTIFKTPEDGEK